MKRLLMSIPCFFITFFVICCLLISGTTRADSNNSGQVTLTPEERTWLAAHPEIRIGLRDTPPLVMKDEKSGLIYGLSLDYIHLLESRLGVSFRLVYFDTWRELIERARNRDLDVMVTTVWTPERSAWLDYTRPYITLFNKIIARRGSTGKVESIEKLRGKRVAVLDGSAVHEYMKRYEGLLTIVPRKDEKTALADVAFGVVEVAVMDIARASYYIREENITNLEIIGSINYNYEYGFSSRRDRSLLNSILSKGLASISEKERDAIYDKWIIPLSPAVSIFESGTFWLSVMGSGFFVFAIMMLFWNRTLRRRILQSNSELLAINEQLHQAQKMEAVGQLAGGIAHDFNNILMAVVGYGDLLRMKVRDDPALCRLVDNIIQSANRAASLTNDLLAFSRRKIMNPQPVDLNEIIRHMEMLLRKGLGGSIELRNKFNNRETFVYAEPSHMELALVNLANNARDAMPKGGVLTIETDTVEMDAEFRRVYGFGKEGLYAVMSISDTGTGMDEETKMRIFEPFFTTKEVGKGTGLGLSMVYGVIKQHNGYIHVDSEPDKGSTFRIYLPLLPAGTEKKKISETAREEKPIGGTETLLMAEDDEVLRKLNKGALEAAGYRVIAAADGEDAVNRFLEHKDKIQLVILDVIMPRKSGMEAYIEIRKSLPDIRALFISGYTAEKFAKRSINIDESELLVKPISPGALLKKVREILDRQR
jgi:signal transduction histidine kinase/ActR/RegA family two-component response regulator